ncbi:MAG: PRC-barrel domain-containing protein [Hyphomicrobium sp.]
MMKPILLAGVSALALTMAGLVAVNAEESKAPAGNAALAAMPKATVQAGSVGYATTQAATDWRSSKVVGLNVYNGKNEKIGDINDLIIDTSGAISHAVVGVGGFLGIGEKNVAIPFATLKMARDKDGKISAMVDSTKEALAAAPAFTFYSGKS